MPHQCTNCAHVFPDGSKAMLSGCPDCGGNTFQFLPKGAVPADDSEGVTPPDPSAESDADTAPEDLPVEAAEPTEPTEPADAADSTAPPERPPSRGPVGRATAAVRDWMRVDSPSPTPHPDGATRTNPIESKDGDETDVEVDRDGEFASEDDAVDSPAASTGNAGDDVVTEDRPTPDADTPEASTTAHADAATDTDQDADDTTPADTDSAVPANADDGIGTGTEDRAQADARRDVVAADEFPSEASDSDSIQSDSRTPPSGVESGRIAAEPSGDRPDLDELRRELNDQFESIKIVAPGQYELNLMELYNREEYIIALREDGRYAIEAPETWLGRRADRD